MNQTREAWYFSACSPATPESVQHGCQRVADAGVEIAQYQDDLAACVQMFQDETALQQLREVSRHYWKDSGRNEVCVRQ